MAATSTNRVLPEMKLRLTGNIDFLIYWDYIHLACSKNMNPSERLAQFSTPSRRQIAHTFSALTLAGAAFIAGCADSPRPIQTPATETPGITETQPQAIPIIDFRIAKDGNNWQPAMEKGLDGNMKQLTSRYFLAAQADTDTAGNPEVSIVLNDEGSLLMEELTRDNMGKVIGIFADNQLISSPVVNGVVSRVNKDRPSQIAITGISQDLAKNLAARLNAEAKITQTAVTSTETPALSRDVLQSPPNGFRKFNSTYLPYGLFAPSQGRYENQNGQDVFFVIDTPNQLVYFSVKAESLKNPSATVDDYARALIEDQKARGSNASVFPNLNQPVTPDVRAKLEELSKIKIDGKDTRIIYSTPGQTAIPSEIGTYAIMVDSKSGKEWVIRNGLAVSSMPIMPGMLDAMAVMMKSFHSE